MINVKVRGNLFKLMHCILLITISAVPLEFCTRFFYYFANGFDKYYLSYGSEEILDLVERKLGIHVAYLNRAVHSVYENGYFKFTPNQVLTTGCYSHPFPTRINNHGFRGRDYDIQKPAGVTRIITFGASPTFGYHSRDNFTYPVLLEKLLSEKLQGKVEVINAGMTHAATRHMKNILIHEMLRCKPDIITIYAGMCDLVFMDPLIWPSQKDPNYLQKYRLKKLKNLSLFVKTINDYLLLKFAPTEKFDKTIFVKNLQLYRKQFFGTLKEIIKICKNNNINVILTSQSYALGYDMPDYSGITYYDTGKIILGKLSENKPLKEQETKFAYHFMLMQELKDFSKDQGVVFANCARILDEDRKGNFASYVHLTEKGNMIVARLLLNTIFKNGFQVAKAN